MDASRLTTWSEALPSWLGPQADRPSLEEAAALLREKDPELFFEGLLVFAGRRQKEGKIEVAAAIYERLATCPLPALAERARRRLSALIGQGSAGGRAEFLFSQFAHQATDYRVIVPMLAGTTVFQLTRAAALGRLAGGSAWFSRGLAARATAALGGFAAEVPTFSLLSRGLMDLSGETVSWSGNAVAKDLAGSAITLGALKSFAFLGNQAALKSGAQGLGRGAIAQASAFSGLLFAHRAESTLGLRPHSDGATAVTDTLAALVSLGVGAHLGRRALGSGFARWNAELGLRTQIDASANSGGLSPGLAWAYSAGRPRIPEIFRPESHRRLRPLAMSTPEDKGDGEPFFIPTDRIRGSNEGYAASIATEMPFRILVHRNNLYGSRVQALAFQGPVQRYALGSQGTTTRDYRNLHESPSGKQDSTLLHKRSGFLHLRHRIEELGERGPDYTILFRNQNIQPKQATLETRNGVLYLRNSTRSRLVWVMEGSKWRSVDPAQEVSLQDGSWIVLGTDPTRLPENTLDPKWHTVLRVELPPPASGPQRRNRSEPESRWNLIEFESRDPAQLDKIPTTEAYLATLLGQSPDFVTWRFRPLFQALETAGWKGPGAKDLLYRTFNESPVLAELNIGMLADVLGAAHRHGWSHAQLSELIFHEALAGKNGMGFLGRLPKALEESAALQLNPAELSGLVARMAKYEKGFPGSLDTLPEFLRAWQNAAGAKPRLQGLFDFLDRAEVSIEGLRELFPKIPGGEEVFLQTMTRLIPELQKEYGYRGVTTAELGAELVKQLAANSPQAPAREWMEGALSSLPTAFGRFLGLGFSFLEQKQILLRIAEEQGANFSTWWKSFGQKPGESGTTRPEREFFETFLGPKPKDFPVTGLITLGLGFFGLHEINPEVLRAVSPAFLLGASIFFRGGPPAKPMSLGFALRLRLRAFFSQGSEKVQNLRELGRVLETEGYLREARERYEAAVESAESHLESLRPRGPDNRFEAGDAHRDAARAYFSLAGFWDRRPDHRSEALENYQMALSRLEPMGTKRSTDLVLLEMIRARLCNLHTAEAEHWDGQAQRFRAGEHFEAAAEASNNFKDGIRLLHRAARAYARAEPARHTDFARVMQKINDWMAVHPEQR